MTLFQRRLPILLILLLAFGVRVWGLTSVPPGLTHDEANHGREAIGILDGDLRYYFPLNYGSEPLYSYTVAGSMGLLGENLFALRLVGGLFGLLTLAAGFAWARRVFGYPIALGGAALTAVGYWAIVASRMALRATLLPFFLLLAVWCFWQILSPTQTPRRRLLWGIGLGVALAITFHIYLSARVVWLLFPAFVAYLALFRRPLFRRSWLPTLLGLGVMGILIIPMFVYLEFEPEAQTRLSMLDGTLDALLAGDLRPFLNNSWRAVLAFGLPGSGDQFLAYNIPGRPLFTPLTAVLALLGFLTLVWQWRRPAAVFLLFWLLLGILPSLITGPTANTTRNIAALTPLYLLPMLGFDALWQQLRRVEKPALTPLYAGGLLLWIGLSGWLNLRAYFQTWPNLPEVRAAYQTTMLAIFEAVDETQADTQLISTVYPGSAHDVSISMTLLNNKSQPLRWMDGRWALIYPADAGVLPLYVPSATPLHPAFAALAFPEATSTLRPDDLDPSFTRYAFAPPDLPANPVANLNAGVTLLEARWLGEGVPPGGVAELLTVWQVLDPQRVGPLLPPAYTTEARLFTHVLRDDGSILVQADRLDAPSWGWQTGDIVLQVHQLGLPAEVAPDEYAAIVGVYDPVTQTRLRDTVTGADHVPIPPLRIR